MTKTIKGEIVSVSKVLEEALLKYTWQIAVEFEGENPPDLKAGKCEVLQWKLNKGWEKRRRPFRFYRWHS